MLYATATTIVGYTFTGHTHEGSSGLLPAVRRGSGQDLKAAKAGGCDASASIQTAYVINSPLAADSRRIGFAGCFEAATASSTASLSTARPSRTASSVIVSGGAIFTVCPHAPTGAKNSSPLWKQRSMTSWARSWFWLLPSRLGHLQPADQPAATVMADDIRRGAAGWPAGRRSRISPIRAALAVRFSADDLLHAGQGRGAADRVARVRAGHRARRKLVHDLRPANDRRERQRTADALAAADHVRA